MVSGFSNGLVLIRFVMLGHWLVPVGMLVCIVQEKVFDVNSMQRWVNGGRMVEMVMLRFRSTKTKAPRARTQGALEELA